MLLDKFTPFSDGRLYDEVPFFSLVFPLGRLGKGEDLAVYTSAIRTGPPRHPYIKILLYLRLLGWSGLCVPVSIAASAGGWRVYPLREPR